MFEITPGLYIHLSEITFSYVRSAGPGGQNVNKVASKAVLRWDMQASGVLEPEQKNRLRTLFPASVTKEGVVVLSSQLTRDAPRNREDCLEKLRRMIVRAIRVPKKRVSTRPTRASVRRRLENKARKSEKLRRRKVDP